MLGATDAISSVPFENNLETDNGNGEEYIPDVEDELETDDSSDEEYEPANDEHRSDNVLRELSAKDSTCNEQLNNSDKPYVACGCEQLA